MEENDYSHIDLWKAIINDMGKEVFTSYIPNDTNFEPESKPSQKTATPSATYSQFDIGVDIGHLAVDWDKLIAEFDEIRHIKKPNEISTSPKYVLPTPSDYTQWRWGFADCKNEEKEKVHIPVKCVDNTGLEDKLMVGFSYYALNWTSASNDLIEVELDSGETISVFSDRFELECKSTLNAPKEQGTTIGYNLPQGG